MNAQPDADSSVIEQHQLATLRSLRSAAKLLTVQLKKMEAMGCRVAPGPLNFMHGKLLLHSPVRNDFQFGDIESFALIVKLLSPDDAQAADKYLIQPVEWRRKRSEMFEALLVQYRIDVFALHSELVQRGSLTPAAAWMDRAALYIWLTEIKLAGLAYSKGVLTAGHVVRFAVNHVMETLVRRGFQPAAA
jgi:hypothetical protein